MEKASILNLILLLIYSASVIAEAYMDGYLKKTNKLLHGLKLISHGGLLAITSIVLYFPELLITPLIILPFILIRKPLFDYSWSFAYSGKCSLFIGTTSLTDKIVKWLKLEDLENKIKFPILEIIYSCMVFGAIVLAVELGL